MSSPTHLRLHLVIVDPFDVGCVEIIFAKSRNLFSFLYFVVSSFRLGRLFSPFFLACSFSFPFFLILLYSFLLGLCLRSPSLRRLRSSSVIRWVLLVLFCLPPRPSFSFPVLSLSLAFFLSSCLWHGLLHLRLGRYRLPSSPSLPSSLAPSTTTLSTVHPTIHPHRRRRHSSVQRQQV